MLKIRFKKFLPVLSMVLMLCLLVNVLSFSVLEATAQGAIQKPVLKNGVEYVDVTLVVAGSSSSTLGDKISANGAKYDIKLDGEIIVGSLVFNKNELYIEIVITRDVAVDILWNCASKYANCTLYGMGTYEIPQLIQDNGESQSFNAMWITNVEPLPMAITADFRPYLMELGYTEEEANELEGDELVRILLSDGGKINLDVSMEEICQNLFGNSTGPIPDQIIDNSTYSGSTSEDSQDMSSLESSYNKACLVVAIWDYQHPEWYRGDYITAYNSLMSHVYNYGDYNTVVTLVNNEANHANVIQWLAYLCGSANQYVDVYFIGHGLQGSNNIYGFACYDSIDSNNNQIFSNFLYPAELAFGVVYQYSYAPLRLGVGSFCYSAAFKDSFLYTGDVWIGSQISAGAPFTIYTIYAAGFFSVWGAYWYQNVNSYTAHYYADTAGMIELIKELDPGVGRVGAFDYYSNGVPFYS